MFCRRRRNDHGRKAPCCSRFYHSFYRCVFGRERKRSAIVTGIVVRTYRRYYGYPVVLGGEGGRVVSPKRMHRHAMVSTNRKFRTLKPHGRAANLYTKKINKSIFLGLRFSSLMLRIQFVTFRFQSGPVVLEFSSRPSGLVFITAYDSGLRTKIVHRIFFTDAFRRLYCQTILKYPYSRYIS